MRKKQEVMKLWKQCFHDSDEFIRFYFGHKYSDENTLVHEEAGKAVAALQMLPYPMTCGKDLLSTSYISGACTLPEARNKGIMGNLLRQAFARMKQRHIAMSILIPAEPWLFGYYSRFGYATAFRTTEACLAFPPHTDLSPEFRTTNGIPEEEEDIRKLFGYISAQTALHPHCVQHTYEDFLANTEDLQHEGGSIATLWSRDSGEIAGTAFVLPDREKIILKDIICGSEETKKELLKGIAGVWPGQKICYATDAYKGAETSGLAMARITDVPQMLELYARRYPRRSFALEVIDPDVPGNNGTYHIHAGRCALLTESLMIDATTDIPTLTEAFMGIRPESIPEPLTDLIGGKAPHISMMLN